MKNYIPTFVGFSQEEQKTIAKKEFTKNSVCCYDQNEKLVYLEVKNDDDNKIEWEKWQYNKNDYLVLKEDNNDCVVLKEERDKEIIKHICHGDLEIKIYTNSKEEWKMSFYKKGEMSNGYSEPIFETKYTGHYTIRDWETGECQSDLFINKEM